MTFAQCAFIHTGLQRTLIVSDRANNTTCWLEASVTAAPLQCFLSTCLGVQRGRTFMPAVGSFLDSDSVTLLIILDFISETGTRIHACVQQHLLKT